MIKMKILVNRFQTKHNTAPFQSIKIEDYAPAIAEGIAITRKEIDEITKNTIEPTFENTVEALEYAGATLDRITSIFFNLNSAETNDQMQKIAQEVSPSLTELANDITLNKVLFERIKKGLRTKRVIVPYYRTGYITRKKFKGFSRNGALLAEDKKDRLREIDTQLAKLKLTYGENVLAETNNYELHITNEIDLKGLPQDTIDSARSLAKSKDKEGWIFTLDMPSYLPFVTYADNRNLRKEITIAYGKKAFQNNEFDNQENVKKIVSLRHERANLLGYDSHAHFVLEERMAQNPDKVKTFLNDLLVKAKPAAEREFAQLTAFAKKLDGIEQLEKWDGSYYSEKLKQELFNLDDEMLKPYFKLENVENVLLKSLTNFLD